MLAERAGAASAQATPTKEHAATLLGVKRDAAKIGEHLARVA
jgi:hypothetical protein